MLSRMNPETQSALLYDSNEHRTQMLMLVGQAVVPLLRAAPLPANRAAEISKLVNARLQTSLSPPSTSHDFEICPPTASRYRQPGR